MGLRLILDTGEGMGTIQIDNKRASRVSLIHYVDLAQVHLKTLQQLYYPLTVGYELTDESKQQELSALRCLYTVYKSTLKEIETILKDD